MKNVFKLLLSLLLTLNSCYKTEDDTGDTCLDDCTVIQGHITTIHGAPVSNVPVEFEHTDSGMFWRDSRRIKKTKTDKNGFFHLKFYIEDEELGEDADGYFHLITDFRSVDHDKYLLSNSIELRNDFFVRYLGALQKRDTTIELDYYLPKKGLAKIRLENFIPIQEDDFFSVQVLFRGGNGVIEKWDVPILDYQPLSRGERVKAFNVLSEFNDVPVAAGTENVLQVDKRKNGVRNSEDIILDVPENGGAASLLPIKNYTHFLIIVLLTYL
ncbi:hypothetical protein [Flagellimonas sp.]|uniref:hypothetical protein n=1 Tax=Flagellimonas sp. TaxID=2058762 RepID=UPI003BAF38B5